MFGRNDITASALKISEHGRQQEVNRAKVKSKALHILAPDTLDQTQVLHHARDEVGALLAQSRPGLLEQSRHNHCLVGRAHRWSALVHHLHLERTDYTINLVLRRRVEADLL